MENNNVDYRSIQLENCSFAKTILMLVIISYHSIIFWSGNWFNAIEPTDSPLFLVLLARWFNSFHIYAFTLISGYIFYYLYSEKNKYQIFGDFVKNKIKRLIVPYFFVSLFWAAPFCCFVKKYNFKTLFDSFCLGIAPSQLWFLLMLFNVFIIVWLLKKWLMSNWLLGYGICLCLFAIGLIVSTKIPNVFCIWTGLQYVIFFYIGMRLRKRSNSKVKEISIISVLLWLFIDAVLFVFSIFLENFDGLFFGGIRFLCNTCLHLVGAIMAWNLLQYLGIRIKWKSKCFDSIAKKSMSIYLFHQQIIYLVLLWLNGKTSPYIIAIANLLISFCGAYLISLFLMKWNITRIMIGEK